MHSTRDIFRMGPPQEGARGGRPGPRTICRYLRATFWQSETFFSLPSQGQSRLLYLYLLTGPHTLAYHVPGLYLVGRQALREGLRLSSQEFSRALANLMDHAGLKADFERSMLWLPSALEHMGPPANPNIVRGYVRAIQSMPKSPLRSDAILAYGPFLAALGQIFFEPFAHGFPEVCQTVSKPFRIEKRQEYIEKKHPGGSPRNAVLLKVAPDRQAQPPGDHTGPPASRANGDDEPPEGALNYEQNADHARQLWESLAHSKE